MKAKVTVYTLNNWVTTIVCFEIYGWFVFQFLDNLKLHYINIVKSFWQEKRFLTDQCSNYFSFEVLRQRSAEML